MNSPDNYFTIKNRAETELKIKGSKFVGQAEQCTTEDEAESFLNSIRKKYYDASHHCFAFRLGIGKEMKFRFSDAGEPTGTAGKPIYDQIAGKTLTNLIIVVTRYFGGTKLGTGGLTHAYSESAAITIEKAGIKEQFITEEVLIKLNYHDYNLVERLIHKYNGEIRERGVDAVNPFFRIALRRSLIEEFRYSAIEASSGRVKFGENS